MCGKGTGVVKSNGGAVLITGCSSGIGRALATEYLARGRRVVATARRPGTLCDLEGPDCLVTALDVTDGASIGAAVDEATDWSGDLDTLVNNAGYGLMGPSAEIEPDDLRRQLETNVVGPMALIRAIVPAMAHRGAGLIVNIGSVSGVVASPFSGAYCASKAALHALNDSLRMELAPFGIAVVCVQPGAVTSSFGDSATRGLDRFASEDSLYRDAADTIMNRARVSQQGGMPAADFAHRVVTQLEKSSPPPVIRLAPFSRKLPLLGLFPTALRDRILSKTFGLGVLDRRRTPGG